MNAAIVADWILVAAEEDCPPGAAMEVALGERIIALVNVDGEYFAIDGVCPHEGGPLGKAELDGHLAACPWHGWQFDVRTGKSLLSESLVQETYSVKVERGAVWIDVPAPAGNNDERE